MLMTLPCTLSQVPQLQRDPGPRWALKAMKGQELGSREGGMGPSTHQQPLQGGIQLPDFMGQTL